MNVNSCVTHEIDLIKSTTFQILCYAYYLPVSLYQGMAGVLDSVDNRYKTF